ncbi:MAG: FliH/SctL family protein [Clostridium sp.]
MPSSYSNIIRGTKISEKKLISPPILEKILIKEVQKNNKGSEIPEVDIESIYKAIEIEAEIKGKEIIDAYKQKAEEILEDSKIQISELKEKAKEDGFQLGYKEGYSEGYSYGINEAKNEYDNLINGAREAKLNAEKYVEECFTRSRKYIKDVENEILNLVIGVSKKVIITELSQNKEAILNVMESAILKCGDKTQILIKLSPSNAIIVKNEKNRFSSLIDEKCNILILSDLDIDNYTYKIETPSGYVDASIEVQLQLILKALIGDNSQCTI